MSEAFELDDKRACPPMSRWRSQCARSSSGSSPAATSRQDNARPSGQLTSCQGGRTLLQ
jgi:hypothetical protein